MFVADMKLKSIRAVHAYNKKKLRGLNTVKAMASYNVSMATGAMLPIMEDLLRDVMCQLSVVRKEYRRSLHRCFHLGFRVLWLNNLLAAVLQDALAAMPSGCWEKVWSEPEYDMRRLWSLPKNLK